MRAYNRGFSLIELSIALLILGLIMVSVVKLMPKMTLSYFSDEQNKAIITSTSDALIGFIVANNRLPCPATAASNGLQVCGAGNQLGFIPFRTLQLAKPVTNTSGQLLQYAVYRNANATLSLDRDLAAARNRYEPFLPNNVLSAQTNGLDFCFALQGLINSANINSQPYLGTALLPLNMAFILADPGTLNANADAGGDLFDGINNTGLGFELTRRAIDSNYDDHIHAIAFSELAGRLHCAQQVAAVNGAAREAFAADDMLAVALFYQQYRDLARTLSENNVDAAELKLAMTAVDTALFVASTAISIAIAAETAGGVGAAVVIPAAAAAAAQVVSIADAISGLDSANDDLTESIALQTAANGRVTDLTAYAAASLTAATNIDARGLF